MYRTRKLSVFIAVLLLLQLGLPGWPSITQPASAATSGPMVLSFSPADDLTNVPLGTNLKITFDENVRKGDSSAYITIYESASNKEIEKISVGSSQVYINSSNQREVTITRSTSSSNAFQLNTNYHVLIDAGAFLNVSNGAAYAGIQNATTWNFRTVAVVDPTKPVHTSMYPTGNGASITTDISITFSKPVYAASGSIQISSTDDTRSIPVTSGSVTGSGTNQIVIRPDGALLPGSTYTVTIPAQAFQDASGNTYNGTSWSFTTDSAPVNLAAADPFSPADNSNLVPINSELTVKFDKAVQARPNKYVEIRRVSNNSTFLKLEATSSLIKVNQHTVTIQPSSAFEANTAYYVLIDPGAFTEPDPNGSRWFYGISAATIWNFTTDYGNDRSAPVLNSRTPAQNGTANGVNTLLTMTFNEPVFPSSGDIEIRQVNGGTLFRSIPITSARVTGGGTNTLTIDANKAIGGEAAKSFVNNTKYYVTVGNRAIRDAAGNFFGGISGTSGWSFTVTQDTVRPTLNAISPANNATAVGLLPEFAASFSKPVMAWTGEIRFNPVDSNAASMVKATFWVDPDDSKRIIIRPIEALKENTNYYITIEEEAITDLVGNRFVGILNQYQWTFQTIGGDKTPPAITKSEVSGTTLRIIFNEPLNANLKPSPASFYVTVNGAARSINSVTVAGNTVSLTLSSSVGSNQQVRVSYTKPAVGLVQDLSGNQAASFSNVEVSNGFSSNTPVIVGGSASGNQVVLNFSEQLATVNAYAYTQFSVSAGGSNYFTTSISNSGTSVTLYLSSSIPSGQTVYVSYSPSSYPLTGVSGITVSSFSNYNLSGSPGTPGWGDTLPPILQSVTASGTTVTIKYNEALSTYNIPGTFQYSVLVDGSARTVSSLRISGDSVILTLSSSVLANQKVRVSYIGSSNTVTDIYGNPAASFTNITANESLGTGLPGSMQGAIMKGSAITLSFNEVLNPASIPATSMFLVRVNDMVRIVTNVQVSGTAVILTLSTPGGVGDRVSISYFSSDNGLKTIGGMAISSFSNVNAANQTTLLDTLTGDYEAADGDGIALKTSATTTSADVSPAGVAASRYTIMNDRFITAVTTSRDAGIASPRIVFKVPSHEKAAIVGISVIALDMANKQGGNVTLVVEHNDASFELPLRTLNFSELGLMVGGNGVSNQVLIQIDQGSTTLTTALVKALGSSKASMIAGPVHYEVAVANGATKQALNTFNGYLTQTMKASTGVDASQTAVVWLDAVTGTLSYAPTALQTVGNVTTANFKRQGSGAYVLVRNTFSFSDISKHWAADSIQMMARKFIVEGMSVTQFEPNKAITRGEFATYIAKGLGLSGNRTAAAKFSDVNTNTVMGAYIGAAAAASIVKGNTDGTFKPNNPITRQDMAAMMMRAAKTAGLTVSLPQSEATYLQPFSDSGKISSYAKTDVAQAIYLGIINGKTPTTLSPLTNATRAEGTVMIMRLLEKAGFLTQ